MDGSVRSGGVLKKKSSSGCLIIKKKDKSKNSGEFGGFSNSQQKKRPRLTVSYSSSSDEDESLEFLRRKVIDRRINNSSAEGRKFDRNDGGMAVSGEKKRNSLDLFEFDEYDEFDGEKMKNNYLEDRLKMVGQGNSKKFGVGTSNRNLVADKREKGLYFDRSSGGRSDGVEGGVRDEGDDETKMPISFLKLKHEGRTADEPIRLQGKNGVLKVMVNKKKKMDIAPHKNDDHREIEHKNRSISENDFKDEAAARLKFYSDSKSSENQGLPIDKEGNNNKGKKEAKLKKGKPFLTKDSKVTGSAINGTETTLKLATPGSQACSSKERRTKKAEDRFPTSVSIIPAKGKERKGEKSKQSGSTEKQMLREKIRKMLIDAGWTIDYRPRRNRDYLDAVYINPGGTAYWSIIKAYDAFLKQLEEDDGKNKLDVVSPSFAPLSEDLLNKLTRQTKKKIKEESERKRKVDPESEDYLSDESHKRKPRKVRVEKSTVTVGSNIIQGRTSKVIGRCTLLARGSAKGENSYSDGYVSHNGKRTILSWLVDSGSAKLSEKVQYKNRKRNRVMLEGWITRDGIHCGCCSKILPVSKFELHAGSKLRQPFQNIYLESGDSLLQSQIDAWNRQEESIRQDIHYVDVDGGDPDDDTCGICGDGGDLICCDSCPSTFHQICLDIKMLPSGDWHCPNCTCRYCGDTNAPGSGNTADEPIKCICCEKKYHKSCSEWVFAAPSISNSASICGQKCQELYDHLQKILGVKHELEAGFSWSLVQRTDVSDTSHRNFPIRVECNSKLAVALSVMNECFLPIFDRRSGINLMNSVIYNCGSNFNRLNYSGFYTAILERGDEVISASSIRIHGTRLAEMPFIGTREIYRRQGMCRRLLSAIETALTSMGVEKLIIPAISEHMNTWTTVFSFDQLDDVLKKEIKSMNMLVFPGTDMLQKQLIKQEHCEVFESEKNQLRPSDLENSVVDLSMEHSNRVENDVGVCPVAKIDENVGALDSDSPGSPVTEIDENVGTLNSDSQALAFPSNDAEAASASDDALCESDVRLASKGTTVTMSKETDQREGTSGLKCPPTPGESNNSSGTENPLPHPASNDKTNSSMETTVRNACKSNPDASRVESIRDSTDESTENQNLVTSEGAEVEKVQVTMDSAVKDSEDAAPEVEATDGCAKSMLAPALETFAKSTTDKPNGVSFTMTVVSEEPLVSFNPNNELAVPVARIEPSYDCTAATNDRISVAGVTVGALTVSDASGDKASSLLTSCIMEVRCEQIDSVEERNENPILNSTSLENVENALKFSTVCDNEVVLDAKSSSVSVIVQKEVAASAESDKLNGEIEMHRAVDEKVTTTMASHEDSRDTSTTENQPKPSTY